jgi:phosphatidylinositol alpha-1,6-mannosyltransferase
VAQHLAQCTVAAIPSREEGFGIALLEAMAAGCPTVATNVGGMGEIVGDSDAALLVPPDNSSALAEAIVSLLNSPERRRALGGRARRRAMAPQFDWQEIARRYVEIMEDSQ